MAAVVGKYAANKLLRRQMKNYQSKNVESGNDPYFAQIEDPKRPGKFKKVKKQIPAYIPEHDANILASVRKSAYRLDMCLFDLFGIRFGWEAVIGIIPGFGDVVGVLMALLIWKKCQKVSGGLPSTISTRMLMNIIIDFVVGLVPFIGDLADAAFKANTRNVRLLEEYLDNKHRPSGQGRDERDLVGGDEGRRRQNRKSGIYHPRDPPPATVFEDFSDEEDDRRNFMRDQGAVRQPQAARAPEERKGGGFFSGRNSSRQQNTPMMQTQETGSVRR